MTRCPEADRGRSLELSLRKLLLFLLPGMLSLGACTRAVAPQGGSPVEAYQGRVLVASAQGAIYALDPQAREKNVPFPAQGEWVFPQDKRKLGTFYASPLVAEDRVYVGSYEGQLLALYGASGQPPGEGVLLKGGAMVGSPVLEGEVLYVASGPKLLALDPLTGQPRWSFSARDRIWATPLVAGDTVYVASLDHRLYALNAADGSLLWEFQAKWAVTSSPALSGGSLYLAAFDGLYRLDARTGQALWPQPFRAGGWFWGSPLWWEGKVFAGAMDGYLYALDASSGQSLWKFDSGAPILASPVLEGALVVASNRVYGLDPGSGRVLWSRPEIGSVVADLRAQDGVVYVHGKDTQDTLWALRGATGEVLWRFPLKG